MDQTLLFLLIAIIALLIGLLVFRKSAAADAAGKSAIAVSKDLYDNLLSQQERLTLTITEKEAQLRHAHAQIAAKDQHIQHLQEKLDSRHAETEQLQAKLNMEFEILANRLLEEKSRNFTEQNARQLQNVLSPLKEKIQEFEAGIERKFLEETREKSSLKKEIEQLLSLNQQLSRDADNLAKALKGQSKVQGDWGELQLEILLEKSGLLKGAHFNTQRTYRDEDGAAKRPDFIVELPDNRQMIIDAKVSLTAFEQYFNENNPEKREQHLKAHADSLRRHVLDLSSKNYQAIYQINSPEYMLLFVPLETALQAALQADPKLLTDALERNVILVSAGSLMTTLRTVAFFWKQDKQTRSVVEIARQSGLLYDKFVAFLEDLRVIGARLDNAQTAYTDAMNKLVNSPKTGDTLIGRAEKLRELGAKTTKQIPSDLLQSAELNNPDEP
jgi:DNA recombination protein RmuC